MGLKQIVASCGTHGDVEIWPSEVSASVIKFPDSETYQFRFKCPIDHEIIVKPCEFRRYDILRALGVELKEITMPPYESGGALPAINESDLADLLIDLNGA